MRHHLFLGLISCWIATFSSTAVQAKPIWKFSVVVAVEKQTADFYQAMLSKPIMGEVSIAYEDTSDY